MNSKFKFDLLPNKEEYLLNLINNNYSMNTVDNYRRDLEIFELFLLMRGKVFNDVNKLLINEYKGYLRTGQHLLDIDKLEKSQMIPEGKLPEGRQVQNPEIGHQNSRQIRRYKESSSSGSRNGRSSSDGLHSRSINRMLSSLRAYFGYLVDSDIKIPIPPSAIKLIKTEKTEKQVADFEELVSLIESPEIFETKKMVRYRNRAILELFFSTGMRISEVVNLDRSHLKTNESGTRILDSRLYIMGKGKKQRHVYLTDRATRYLERYLKIRNDNYPALFIPYKGTRKIEGDKDMVRISSRYIQDVIAKYKKKLGILVPTTPHSLRHGFATYLAEKGANPAAIQHLLGHESLQTTTRYVHASDKYAEQSHKEFHPLQ